VRGYVLKRSAVENLVQASVPSWSAGCISTRRSSGRVFESKQVNKRFRRAKALRRH